MARSSGLVRSLVDKFWRKPSDVYNWFLRGKVVQKTQIHRWQKNDRAGTHFSLVVADSEGQEIKLTMFQFTEKHWTQIREGGIYDIANPGRARIGRLLIRNRLFNRLPTDCELVFDYIETYPIQLSQLFQEQATFIQQFRNTSLNYYFLASLADLEKEGNYTVWDVCAVINSDDEGKGVRTLMLCDESKTEVALILYRNDRIACKFPDDSTVGQTISIKDAIYRENSGRYRQVLKLKHQSGSYVIVGDREDPDPIMREEEMYLPKESDEGRRRKRFLKEWWSRVGEGTNFRNLSRTRAVCPLSKFIEKAPSLGKIYDRIFATIECPEVMWPNYATIADETGVVPISLCGSVRASLLGIRKQELEEMDSHGPSDWRRFDFRQVIVECSCTVERGEPRVEVEAVEEVPFGELARHYAQLIGQL
jgi:hypothetical protein